MRTDSQSTTDSRLRPLLCRAAPLCLLLATPTSAGLPPGTNATVCPPRDLQAPALGAGGAGSALAGDRSATGTARGLRTETVAAATAPRPNIFITMLDDAGFNDIGRYTERDHGPSEHRCEMPVMSGLSEAGIKLQFYSMPLCSPTRAAIMTGRYPHRYGSQTHVSTDWVLGSRSWMPRPEASMAERIKAAGYSTRMVGKWHLGHSELANVPTGRGFDEFVGKYGGMGDHWSHQYVYSAGDATDVWPGHPDYRAHPTTPAIAYPVDLHHEKWQEDGTHSHEIIFDKNGTHSVDVISDAAAQMVYDHPAEDGQPLFLYVTHQSPHFPVQNPAGTEEKHLHIPSRQRRKWCGLMSHTDEGLGRVIAAFQATGLWQDTVFMFLSDNGGDIANGASNWPHRGTKGSFWEGGTKNAAFLYSENSDLIPDERRGTTSPANVYGHVADIFPTFVSLAGGDASPSSAGPLDGYDMWAAWVHGAPSPRQELVYNVESIGIQETWAEMNFYNMSRQRFWRTAVKPDTTYMTPLPGETLDEFKAKWNPGAAIPGGGTGRYYAVRVGAYKIIEHGEVDPATARGGDWSGTDPTSAKERGEVIRRGFSGKDATTNLWLFNLEDDPLEELNLADEMPEKVAEMRGHASRIVGSQHVKSVLASSTDLTEQERHSERELYLTQFKESPRGGFVTWWDDAGPAQPREHYVETSRSGQGGGARL